MRRLTRHVPWVVATAGIVASGVRLRSRLAALPVLDDFLAGSGVTELPGAFGDDFELVTAAGVTVDRTTLRAAIRFARFHELDVVDLIPGDLPVRDLYELARLVNPRTFRSDPMATGHGAGHATLVRSTLLPRLRLPGTEGLDPVQYVEAMVQLKRFAPTSTELVVAPGLDAVPHAPGWRLPRLKAIHGPAAPAFAAGPAVVGTAVQAGPAASRLWGTAAVAAYAVQPFLATARLALQPRDLRLRTALGRPGRHAVDLARSLRAEPPAPVQARADEDDFLAAARRHEYTRLMSAAGDHFEPPLARCPWCDSEALRPLATMPDLLQRKPGTFRLDECGRCGHVFQNPRLSIDGLDFYYRDFYDGIGYPDIEMFFSRSGPLYEGRARLLEGVARPKRWLDVGTGHGHFCLYARGVWPETRFDGLDMSDAVIEAQRRGWIEHSYRGMFPAVAENLMGAYDVVSMHHYLEHTREPRAELDAARTVLEPGGHLLVEVPDPESRVGRAFGPLWCSWFQPQHQHLVPLGNLVEALADRGFTIVATQRGAAHIPADLGLAMWLLARRVAPAGDLPWAPPPTPARRIARTVALGACAPVVAGAFIADQALAPLQRRLPGMSNTYRVLARKD